MGSLSLPYLLNETSLDTQMNLGFPACATPALKYIQLQIPPRSLKVEECVWSWVIKPVCVHACDASLRGPGDQVLRNGIYNGIQWHLLSHVSISHVLKSGCKEDGTVYHMSRAARHERTGPSRRRARR
jgi:hypothetical protein